MFTRTFIFIFWILSFLHPFFSEAKVQLGIDVFIEEGHDTRLLSGKKIGLITNHTAVNKECMLSVDLLKRNVKKYELVALFAPEHGFYGEAYAYENVKDQKIGSVPIYSLHGEIRRPTDEMLKGIDALVFDIQDIGSRSYTFVSTLCYCMEEAAKHHIKFIVLDRPNPLGGEIVDGPLMDAKWRSFLGYLNVPYCHGMTVGEIAKFFNEEYHVGCDLEVIPMRGWKREMTFQDTHLCWVPTSPQIPEEDTPFFYPTTGLIGHCSMLSIGIGYTLPFKVLGAPWMDGKKFADVLNAQHLPGVHFQPFYFRPFFGKYKSESCQGVRIVITNTKTFLPMTTQYTIMGVVKNLYPEKFAKSIQDVLASKIRRDNFNKLNGNDEFLELLLNEKFFIWKIREVLKKDREQFLEVRKKYLLPGYANK